MNLHNVIDVSHWNKITDFEALKEDGILGVICKATQGTYYQDDHYHDCIAGARAAGLLVGAYHFIESGDVEAQVDYFLNFIGPNISDLLLALDHEPEPHGRTASLDGAREFVHLIHEKTGQWPKIYSGHLLKEQLGNEQDELLKNCDLWLAQYNASPTWPPNWDKIWLWQYSDKGRLKGVPGGNVDLNHYDGTDLAKEWVKRDKSTVHLSPTEIAVGVGGSLSTLATTDWITGLAVTAVIAAIGAYIWFERKAKA